MREDLKQELFRIAINRARLNQFTFPSFLETELQSFISQAVDKMSYSEYSSETKKNEAKDNTIVLVDALLADGRVRRLNEAFDYKSFFNVRSSICPLWPFC